MDLATSVAAFLTLAIMSFVFGDNPFYKFAERLLVGLAVGYSVVITTHSALVEGAILPITRDGQWLLLLPLGMGALMFGRFFAKTSWLSAFPLAATIGAGAGAAIPALLQARILSQLGATVGVFADASSVWGIVSALVLVSLFLAALTYFYFGRKREGALDKVAQTGAYALMIYFGATIGFTVMSRMSILIGRFDFLLRDWLGVIH